MNIPKIKQENFQKEVLEHKGVVFVDFYADWCGPCKISGPIVEQLADDSKYKDKVKFVQVDVDMNQELAGKYNIFSIPTFLMFEDGVVKNQFSGARDKTSFESELDQVV